MAAKQTWGSLMWDRQHEFLDLEENPEVRVDYNGTDIILTPIEHGGSIYELTKPRVRSVKLNQAEDYTVLQEQNFWPSRQEVQGLVEMDDIDWMYSEHGIGAYEAKSIRDDENNEIGIQYLSSMEEMEKAGQMGIAQMALVNFLPEPLERDWSRLTGSIEEIWVSERSRRIGDILSYEAEESEQPIRAYFGFGHLNGIWSTIRENSEKDEGLEIEMRHGARPKYKRAINFLKAMK